MFELNRILRLLLLILTISLNVLPLVQAQFVHPGITHKKSDLDRIKYMVEAKIDPWYSSYQEMAADSKASYSYTVRGDASFTELGRDNGVNYSAWNSDIRAAYYNAIEWYVTSDVRHAQKAVEIFNAWRNLTAVTSGGTESLSGGVGYIMIEAAEIIKSTYSGWSAADIEAFKNMLVYPGYSNTGVPASFSKTNGTFYWKSYQGDAGRHGNQGLSGWRTVMAMGIFLDNKIMYDRALRYIKGLPHRSDDIPYPSGPPTSTSILSSDDFSITYNTTSGNTIPDYGFNEVMTNYIWETGQCQESSRDQAHTAFGIGLLTSMAEMAWNQGDDLYSHANDRLLLGLEYNMRYNVSYLQSYPDQTSWWIPTVASGEFKEGFDRTGRWFSKAISPTSVGGFPNDRPVFEMPVAHYLGRGIKTADQVKWIKRARDIAIEKSGYEVAGWTNDAIGWGALTARRPDGCFGDPISGIDTHGLPIYAMNVVPCTIEAENFDNFAVKGEGHTYHDLSSSNSGGQYRTTDDVDIDACSEGGYMITSLENGEWLTYTVYTPATALYNLKIRYASSNGNGKIQFSFGGENKTAEVAVPFGAPNSTGLNDWKDLTLASNLILKKGVQSMKIKISGASNSFVLNNIKIENGTSTACSGSSPAVTPSYRKVPGINYSFYQGTWDAMPNFSSLTPVKTGLVNTIDQTAGSGSENFGLVFTGWMNVLINGNYTFYTTSDAGSRLTIDGKLVVDNDGLHSPIEKSGDICLDEGYHDIKVEYFEKTGGKELTVSYAGPGTSKRLIENLYGIGACENVGVSAPADLAQGIHYNYYEGSWSLLPDFKSLTPVKSGTATKIDLSPRVNTDNMGLVFDGYINIATEGEYTFYTTSDDGSRLWIDGKKVVDNDGTHSSIEKSGFLCLGAGYHKIKVEYFDKTGSTDVLMAMYAGPGFTKRFISDLYYSPSAITSAQILKKDQDLVVYPNPVKDILHIELPEDRASALDFSVQLYNCQGSKVAEINPKEIKHINIDLSGLSQGIYYLVISDKSKRITKQIIKL